jgi:hypothetical protein
MGDNKANYGKLWVIIQPIIGDEIELKQIMG